MSDKEKYLLTPNRNYKDSMFRMLFREKKELLTLFNAIHGTSYDNEDELQVTTLDNAVYMSFKNDISCILDMTLALYEHQSTVNPNMPLRNLFYVSRLLENYTKGKDIYSGRKILLPVPKFIVLYNGSEPQPEWREFRLSDSFARKGGDIHLELVVIQLNINPGYNTDLVQKCPTLLEYIQYTDRVRRYGLNMSLEQAVEKAVNECIEEGILADFLRKNRNEVIPMSIFEYDEEKHMKTVREEGFEDGYEDGVNRVICNMLRRGRSPELISECVERPLEYIYGIEQELLDKEGEGSNIEVVPMSIFEYDEEKHMKTVREEGFEDGVNQIIHNMFQLDQSPELISKCVKKPLEYIYAVEQEMRNEVRENSKYDEEEDIE